MRREIDSSLKRKISRLWNSKFQLEIKPLKHFIVNPNEFVVRKLNPKSTETFIKSGFAILPNSGKVIIPKKGADSVHIKNSEVIYTRGSITEHVYLGSDYENILKKANTLNKGLKRNQLLSFKIGDNAISTTRYLNLEDMHKYLTHVLMPRAQFGNDWKAKEAAFFSQISIVTVDGDMPKWAKKKINAKRK